MIQRKKLWINIASYIAMIESERDTYKKMYNDKLAEQGDLEKAVDSLAFENFQMERRRTLQLLEQKKSLAATSKDRKPNHDESDSDDDIFFDAVEKKSLTHPTIVEHTSKKPVTNIKWRTQLPAFQQKEKISVWSVLKNNLGKSLSRITLPIVFNEPLSVLQRCSEDLEYSHLLDTAAKLPDSRERLAYAAAFQLSAYSTTMHRTSKPFNPLLGETFELIRPERGDGFQFFAEQVYHHPPVSAVYARGDAGWQYEMTVDVESAFKGTSLEIYPKGYNSLRFLNYDDRISYVKITTCVHNIVIGKMWVDNYGQARLYNHTTKDVCVVDVEPYDWFKGTVGNLTGKVLDADGNVHYTMKGNWNDSISLEKVGSKEPPKVIWKKHPPPPNQKEQYNFTSFAITLNELQPSLKAVISPTDCRLRPDQRLFEEGKLDESQKEKDRLEEKQRYARRLMEARGEEHKPKWFKLGHDEQLAQEFWIFTDEYFKCREKGDWSRCPDLY